MQKVLPFLLLVGCNSGLSQTEADDLKSAVSDLQTRVEALETENTLLHSQVDTVVNDMATAQDTLTPAGELLSVMSVSGDGDVVIDGANLFVQSGAGETDAAPNGKGNIYLGYNEPEIEGTCVGGSNPGSSCDDSTICAGGGTCDITVLSESTGSHNLIVGEGHTHTSHSGLTVGLQNRLEASQCSTVGAGNTCAAREAFVAGRANTASGDSCSVLGGAGGTCSGAESVVLGGLGNEATVDQSIVP